MEISEHYHVVQTARESALSKKFETRNKYISYLFNTILFYFSVLNLFSGLQFHHDVSESP